MPQTEPATMPRRAVDQRGRAIPMTEQEARARAPEIARGLDRISEMTDATDTDELWDEVQRGIDAARTHRKLFEGSA